MNFFGVAPTELLLILIIAMVVVGPGKLPEVAGEIGRFIREFRRATEELSSTFSSEFAISSISDITDMIGLTEPAASPGPISHPAPSTPVDTFQPGVPSFPTVALPPKAAPPILPGIELSWTHGTVSAGSVAHYGSLWVNPDGAIADDWIFGVPVEASPPTFEPEPIEVSDLPAEETIAATESEAVGVNELEPPVAIDTPHESASASIAAEASQTVRSETPGAVSGEPASPDPETPAVVDQDSLTGRKA